MPGRVLTNEQWKLALEHSDANCARWQRAADVWEERYLALVNEPLPTLLWRRMLVQGTRLLGR